MSGQATIGPPEDQISDFARVRILNIPKMKALEHMKQELAKLNHKPAFGDLEIADAEVESQHKDLALKAVEIHEDKGPEDKTIVNLNFALRTSANCKTVHLLGSWDNYTGQLPLSKHSKKVGGWVGNFKFQGTILEQGRRYWYYYIIDGYHVSHDPARESTTEPITGRKLNFLDVPGATPGSAAAPASRTSATSSNNTKRYSRRVSSDTPKGRALSPSKIFSPTPIKPTQARQRDSEFDSDGDLDVPSLMSRPLTSRSSNSSCPSSVSSGSSYCTCERYGITQSGERVMLNCGGARCGYIDDSSECFSEDDERYVERTTRRQGVVVRS